MDEEFGVERFELSPRRCLSTLVNVKKTVETGEAATEGGEGRKEEAHNDNVRIFNLPLGDIKFHFTSFFNHNNN